MTELFLPIDTPGRVPSPAQDQPRRISEILIDFTSGLLQKPEHQREADLWEIDKKRAFVLNVANAYTGKQPLGVIATYELVANQKSVSPQFLNDGLQRLSTLNEVVSQPSAFYIDEEGVQSILRQAITVQHRHYDDHIEAMRWFQYLNYGSQLTPYEHCQGYFAYLLPNYKQDWEPFVMSLRETVRRSCDIVGIRDTKSSRETRHKILRHHYALLWRFLTCDAAASCYRDVTAGNVRSEIEKDQTTEQKLIKLLLELGIKPALDELNKFDQHIRSTTVNIQRAIRAARGDGYTVDGTLFRWLLDASILRRNAQIPVKKFDEFMEAMIAETRGRARWACEDSSDINLRLANLEPLPDIAKALGFDFLPRPRRPRAENLMAGYDAGHPPDKPWSVNGDGPTTPEPASVNRARGARAE